MQNWYWIGNVGILPKSVIEECSAIIRNKKTITFYFGTSDERNLEFHFKTEEEAIEFINGFDLSDVESKFKFSDEIIFEEE